MTNKKRFMTAVCGEVPDMVPVSPLIHDRYAHQVLGRAGVEAWCEVHEMIGSVHHRGQSQIDMQVSLPEQWSSQSYTTNSSADRITTVTTIHTPYGTLASKHIRGSIPEDPLTGKVTEYFVKDVGDWRIYAKLCEQQLAGIGEANWAEYRRQAALMGENHVPLVWIEAPFCQLMQVRGMEQIMTDLYDCPDILRGILGIRRQILSEQLKAVANCPAELFGMDICWATGAGLGPRAFAEWVLPDVAITSEAINPLPNKYLGLYTLGRIAKLLPMLVDTEVDFIETFEQNEGDITLAEAKRLYGDRVCLVGNFDCLVLAFGTVEEAQQEARRCLQEGMEGGSYVLATADEVPADCRMDNLKAMVETIQKYGRYE